MKPIKIFIRRTFVLLCFLFAATLPVIAGQVLSITDTLTPSFANASLPLQTMELTDSSFTITAVLFGVLLVYAAYRYWADAHRNEA